MDPTSKAPDPKLPRYRGRTGWALALLLALGLLAALVWNAGAERRAIERLDPVQRRAVYEQSFGEFQRLCGAGPRDDALERRCADQVTFLLQFPECDARCQEIARSHAPRPTK
jgi:hypothetical protein